MYSERLRELFASRQHAGKLDDATHYGEGGTPGQGPFIQLWLRIDGHQVTQARFKTYGCPAAIACGEALCEAIEGKDAAELGEITGGQVACWVGGVPDEKTHCPPLAAKAWNSRRNLVQEFANQRRS